MCVDKLSYRPDLVKLGFCMAILNTFNSEDLRVNCPNSSKSIFASIYNIVMDIYCRYLIKFKMLCL